MFENKQKDKKVEDILKEIEREFGKDKGKKTEEEIEKGMDVRAGYIVLHSHCRIDMRQT